MRHTVCRVFLGLALSGAAHAAVDPALLSALRWRSLGPYRGGRVLAVTGVPGEPHHFYFGAVNGGVWETDDAGRTWHPVFDAQPVASIGALAVAPSDPRTLYAGTGEADMRSDISQGEGAYKSTDGGKTWAFLGLADTQQIGRILVDPRAANRVFLAALGHPYGPNAERGVYRSLDGGKSWTKVLYRDDATGAIDLAFKPGDARVVYAALWHTRRPPWNVYPPSNGPGSGLFKSTDGGDTWTPLTKGLPADAGNIGIGVVPGKPERVYAMVDAAEGGLYRSDDEGASWTRVNGDRRLWGRGWYFGNVVVEPREPDTLYACNTSLYRSTDGGRTFAPVKGAPGGDDYHDLWIDPAEPRRRILASDQGAVVSLNGGATWSSWYNQPTAQIYRVATDQRFPYWVYGSQQDSGALALPSRTTVIDGVNASYFRQVTAGGENDTLAPDPRNPEHVFGGRVEMYDQATGQTRTLNATLAHPDHYRGVWTLPLVFAPRDPKALYFANQRLFRTTDEGGNWTPLSPDLTREDPGVPPNLDASAAANRPGGPRRGVIYTIAPSRLLDRDLWVGTDDGLVWRSRDDGAHWSDVTPRGVTAWSKVAKLETSHFDAETAYAAVDRHRLEDVAPYLYRTRDGGRSWTLAVNGLPRGAFLNAVREDPARRGLLYAGTERGVYVSFDDGERWQPLQQGLPVTSVRDLVVHGDDLVIGTHGRGFYVLDDLAPLRQAADVPAGAPWLFTPSQAVRLRPSGFTGTPFPRDEPMAPNPPYGAAIDYLLGGPAKEVTLEVLDSGGQLVRRYRSGDPLPPPSRSERRLSPEWISPREALSTAAGTHRFHWPLRHAAPPALGHGNAYADGVWAPPGRYTLVLTVDGVKLTRPLIVKADPRLSLPDAAYQRQLELARRLEGLRESLARAVARDEALHRAVGERLAGADASLVVLLRALDESALAVSEREDPNARGPGAPPRSLTSFRFLEEALDALAAAVDGADAAPTRDAEAGVERAETSLRDALARWESLESRELAAANAALAKAGKPPISLEAGAE